MINNQWYAILSSKEVKRGHLTGVTRFGEKLVLWRKKDGTIGCLADKCCHRGASLCTGKLVKERVQCPFHGFEYDADGKVKFIPANGKVSPIPSNFQVKSYLVKEKGGFVFVWYGNPEKATPEVPFFEDCFTFNMPKTTKSGLSITPGPSRTNSMSSICLSSTTTPSAKAIRAWSMGPSSNGKATA